MVNIWLTTIISTITINHLVGGFNHLEKYEFVNGNDYPIYEMENTKMFETTNQITCI